MSFRRIIYWSAGIAICAAFGTTLYQAGFNGTEIVNISLDYDEISKASGAGAIAGALIGLYKGRY